MRAISYEQHGDDDVLRLVDRPTPKVGPGEVLVEVRAASVNPVDWKLVSGGLDGMLETLFPAVPGWDVAGVVTALGPDVPELAVGDEIVAYARKDVVHGGTFAEQVSVPVRTAARRPTNASWEEAASLPLAGLTAHQALDRLDVGPTDVLLVHNGAGGVGSMAIQLARHRGARVIASASPDQHDRLRRLGAEPVAYGDGLVEAVRELAPEGVHAVADLVGGVLDDTLAVLADRGRHVSIADPEVQDSGGTWLWVRPDAAELAQLVAFVESGALTIEVEQTYSLDDVPAAFARSREGHVHGKIAIHVSG